LPHALAYAESIIATLREPFLVLDKSLCVLTANAAFYRHFHVEKQETEGQPVYELGNGQWNISSLRTRLSLVVNQALPIEDFEMEHVFPVLGRRSMRLNARRFHLHEGNAEAILLSIEDITNQKRAEAALIYSEVRFRRLFQTAQDGILILDSDTGRVMDANPFMTALLGYTREEFLGKELWEIGLFHDIRENRASYQELQNKGYIRYENLPLESRTGQQIEVEFVSNVYAENDHQVVQCNIRDITERSRLQRLTAEQAAALVEIGHRKDEFLAMLSHELRNPLAPMQAAAMCLRLQSHRDRWDSPEVLKFAQSVDIIERQLGQLTRIVDELLEVSRITTGRIQLQQERISFGVVVQHAVSSVEPLIELHKHHLSVSLPTEAIWIHGDAARLEQALVNLLNNAVKYTVDGGSIRLSVEQGAGEAVLRLRDTGVGIDPDALPHIFDLFTQAERSLDRSQGGLGIGLALAQRLVQMHGGTLTATSALGAGSEFTLRLPTILPADLPASPPSSETTAVPLQCLRVMIVDDNRDTVHALAALVQVAGHDVRTAFEGTAVVEMALEYRPHVVLLDIGLPGLTGLEVAVQLRQQPILKDAVLIAMTGYGRQGDRERSTAAGFAFHLVKPADILQVLQILADVAKRIHLED